MHNSVVVSFSSMAKVLENTTALFSKSQTPTQVDRQSILRNEMDPLMGEFEALEFPVHENAQSVGKQCDRHRSPPSSFVGKNSSRHSPAMVQVTSTPR